jgi:hypothetical protein
VTPHSVTPHSPAGCAAAAAVAAPGATRRAARLAHQAVLSRAAAPTTRATAQNRKATTP